MKIGKRALYKNFRDIYREYGLFAAECSENPFKYKIAGDLCVCGNCGKRIPEDKNILICECGQKFQKDINDFFKIDFFSLFFEVRFFGKISVKKKGLFHFSNSFFGYF